MAEAGIIPIPKKLARQGIKDMVTISDGRMSGTAAGTIILYVSPEAAPERPIAAVGGDDIISVNVLERSIKLQVHDEEIQKRLEEIDFGNGETIRGYRKLYQDHVEQANLGCDFGILRVQGKQI